MSAPAVPLAKLLAEVDALSTAFLGKDAEGQSWADTLNAIERMAKLAKQIRKAGGEA